MIELDSEIEKITELGLKINWFPIETYKIG